jgi:hypothetical protein
MILINKGETMPPLKSIDGVRFGRLVANKISGKKGVQYYYECTCDCGSVINAQRGNLLSGHIRSCGCLQRDMISKRKTTHGDSKSPEYRAWLQMKRRCLDPSLDSYPNYGGRGIKLYPEWESSFETFIKDVGRRPSPDHSLDRIDVDGDYVPSNVRWSTRREQQWNKRTSRMVEVDGLMVPAGKLAFEAGIHVNVLMRRLSFGWTLDRALTTPVKRSASF